MSRFSDLGVGKNAVIEKLLQDEEFLKLVAYDSFDPLSESVVANPSSLLFSRIFPYPKIPKAEETQKTIITVMFTKFNLNNNIKFKDMKLTFCIMCHISNWRIKSSTRPEEIISRIDTIFNESTISKINIGRNIIFDSGDYREWNNEWCGFYLTYDLCNFN